MASKTVLRPNATRSMSMTASKCFPFQREWKGGRSPLRECFSYKLAAQTSCTSDSALPAPSPKGVAVLTMFDTKGYGRHGMAGKRGVGGGGDLASGNNWCMLMLSATAARRRRRQSGCIHFQINNRFSYDVVKGPRERGRGRMGGAHE